MPNKFKPNAREQVLIEEARQRLEQDHRKGHYAPAQLVARMTSEGLLTNSTDESPSVERRGLEHIGEANSMRPKVPEPRRADVGVCRVVLAVVVDNALTTEELVARHPMMDCVSATAFKVPKHFLLLEFDQHATHREAAMVASIEAVLRAFPEADFVDLNGPNTLVDELVETTQAASPTHKQLQVMYRCMMPSDESMALAAAAVKGQLARRTRGVRLVEAEVFEVLPMYGIAHLTTHDGRMLCVTDGTPGIMGLAQLVEGQRYQCWVQGRFNLVVRVHLAA